MKPADRELVHAEVERSREAQQLPPTVESASAIAVVVAQLRGAVKQAS